MIENPWTSNLWRHSSLGRWYQDPEMYLCQADLCTFGLESKEGIPMKNGLTLLTNSQAFADDLTRRCDGDHEHQRIQGSETARTAIYPNDFAKAVVKAFDAWRNYAKVGAWSEDVTTTGRPPRTNFPINLQVLRGLPMHDKRMKLHYQLEEKPSASRGRLTQQLQACCRGFTRILGILPTESLSDT